MKALPHDNPNWIGKYVLDANGDPVPEPDLFKWGAWMQAADRRVARTQVTAEVWVSTVFIGLDHNYFDRGPPHLFETVIFHGPLHQAQWRYSTRAQALAGHLEACELARDRELTKELEDKKCGD